MSVSLGKSPALTPAVEPVSDLSAELAALNSYIKALRAFDRKCGELNKRGTFTAAELDNLKRNADELKGRISPVQNALRDAIKKLKAAGEWDGLDGVVARIGQSPSKDLLSQESFKRLLDESVSQLTTDSREIPRPIDVLRSRLKAQLGDGFDMSRSESVWRAIPASYVRPAEPVMNVTFRCRVALLRQGLSAATGQHDNNGHLGSQESLDDARCYCAHDFDSCDFAT
jgi:hypothetical protein